MNQNKDGPIKADDIPDPRHSLIDDFEFYPRVITENEIEKIYAGETLKMKENKTDLGWIWGTPLEVVVIIFISLIGIAVGIGLNLLVLSWAIKLLQAWGWI